MTRVLLKLHLIFLVVVVPCFALQGCATSGQSKPVTKIAMHIDAVLEFVVEYPLLWEKDRRLPFGSSEGEIRWTPPSDQGTLLKIKSQLKATDKSDVEDQIGLLKQEFINLNITLNEKMELPAGEAVHITAMTTGKSLDFYHLSSEKRTYQIILTAPENDADKYTAIMKKVVRSFQFLPKVQE